LSGSKFFERFTVLQILRVFQQRTYAYEDAQRISLVNSFLALLFLDKMAPWGHWLLAEWRV